MFCESVRNNNKPKVLVVTNLRLFNSLKCCNEL